MSFIEVTKGGPSAENDVEDGVYPVILISISDPRTVTARRGPKAGSEVDLIDWTFAVDEGPFDGREIPASSSTASGPKSKMFAYLTALLGGKPPAVGQKFAKEDLIGRRALATVSHDEDGWLRVENLGAMPASMLGARVAQATGAPVAAAAVAAPAPVASAAPTDDLPF